MAMRVGRWRDIDRLGPFEQRAGEEFTCRSCHLIMARSCLFDEERLLCRDCVLEATRALRVVRDERRSRGTVEFLCPACRAPLLLPERHETNCSFFCSACGVHLYRRGRHLHYAWDHRDRPDVVNR